MNMIRKAFTLIEVMIVVAIIALLAVLIAPLVIGSMDGANRTEALSEVSMLQGIWANLLLDKGVYPTPEADNNLTYDSTGVLPGLLNDVVEPFDFVISQDRLDEDKQFLDQWGDPVKYVKGNFANRIDKASWDEATNTPQDTNKPIGDPSSDIAAESDWNPSNKGGYPYIWSYGGDESDQSVWIYQKK